MQWWTRTYIEGEWTKSSDENGRYGENALWTLIKHEDASRISHKDCIDSCIDDAKCVAYNFQMFPGSEYTECHAMYSLKDAKFFMSLSITRGAGIKCGLEFPSLEIAPNLFDSYIGGRRIADEFYTRRYTLGK